MPLAKPPSILSSPVDLTMSPTAPPSVYSFNQSGTSAQSLATHSSGSFTSLVPATADYNFELERLKLEYRRSEESLRLERAHAEAQQALFNRERAEQEARHRQELDHARQEVEALRRQVPQDKASGKRRM